MTALTEFLGVRRAVALWETRADADAAVWLRVGRRDSQFRLTFAAGGDFILDPVARTIAVVAPPDEGVLPDATRHLLIDQVLPLALSHAGALVLHASACAIDGSAVAFVGPAGAGK